MAWDVIHGRHKRNPIDELVKLALFRLKVPTDVDPKVLAKELKKYDLEIDEDGQQWLIRRAEQRIGIWTELAQYCAPKLRSSETKETRDSTINVIISSGDASVVPIKTITVGRTLIEDSDNTE